MIISIALVCVSHITMARCPENTNDQIIFLKEITLSSFTACYFHFGIFWNRSDRWPHIGL